MTTSLPSEQREKLLVNITPQLRRRLKVRAAECGMNVQDAAEHAVSRWYDAPAPEPVETSGAKSWGVLPRPHGPDKFATTRAAREVTKVQGFAQAIELWLSEHPSPARPLVAQPVQRILVANQKGGVGKTFVAAWGRAGCGGVGQAGVAGRLRPAGSPDVAPRPGGAGGRRGESADAHAGPRPHGICGSC